jgi:hypothetical protein
MYEWTPGWPGWYSYYDAAGKSVDQEPNCKEINQTSTNTDIYFYNDAKE